MRKLKVDIEDIGMAMNEGDANITQYFDAETGELIIFNRYGDDIDEDEYEEIEFNDRYELVPRLSASERFRMRTEFANTRKNVRLRDSLLEALRIKRGLSQFRNVLDRNPDDLKEWYEFEREFLSRQVKEWLSELGIEPE